MRLIDADALKNTIPTTHVDIFENCRYCSLLTEEDVRRLVDGTPTVTQWISVKDRLPDDASDVLAYYDDGTESRIIPVNYYKRCWYDCIFNRPIDDLETGFIGYWMPIPEPPEVEQDG